MNNDIYQIDFTQIFPTALQHDPKMIALAKSLTAELLAVSGHMEDVLIYSRLDQLPEELVDILAYDMHVDWYSYEDPLAVKRQTVKDSVKVHKYMGTKYAVETALQALFPGTTVQEWFDYGGKPHHFRISVTLAQETMSLKQWEQLIRAVRLVKRLSSWLDDIQITVVAPAAMLHIGGSIGASIRLGLPPGEDTYNFRRTLPTGGRGGVQSSLGLREDTAPPPSTTILRTGGVCTILSNLSKGE